MGRPPQRGGCGPAGSRQEDGARFDGVAAEGEPVHDTLGAGGVGERPPSEKRTGVPGMPAGPQLSTVMLLIIAIAGAAVAPWQLFFQQSSLIDKRITPRFI